MVDDAWLFAAWGALCPEAAEVEDEGASVEPFEAADAFVALALRALRGLLFDFAVLLLGFAAFGIWAVLFNQSKGYLVGVANVLCL